MDLAMGKTDLLNSLPHQGTETGGCQELASDHNVRHSDTVCIAHGGGWQIRAFSHQRVTDTGFTWGCSPFLINSKGSMKSFLPIMGVKSCLAPAWAFAMALGDGRFHHWMVYPDMGVRQCGGAQKPGAGQQPGGYRCCSERGTWVGVKTGTIISSCKCCLKRGPLSGNRVFICELQFSVYICLCLGLFICTLSCEMW